MSNTNCLKPVVRIQTVDGTGEKLLSAGRSLRGFLRAFVETTAMVDSTKSGEEVVDKQQPGITSVIRSMASMILIYQDRLRVHVVDTDNVEHTRIGVWKLATYWRNTSSPQPGSCRNE